LQASIPAATRALRSALAPPPNHPHPGPYCDLLNKLEKACPHLRELSFSYPPAEDPLFSALRGSYKRDESVRCTARLLRASFWTLPSGTRWGIEAFSTKEVLQHEHRVLCMMASATATVITVCVWEVGWPIPIYLVDTFG